MSPNALARMPRLSVIQLLSAGVESWLPVVPAGVVLCNGRGIHGGPTAELAIAGLLAVLRELPRFVEQQRDRVWRVSEGHSLDGMRVLVLGAGDIGQRVAAVVRLMEAEATLVARHQRLAVEPIAALPGLLPQHDAVVVALPLTPETDGLVDAAFLAAMRNGAVLINVARGWSAQMAGGAELAELAHELEQLGGHTQALKEVQAEVAGVSEVTDVAGAADNSRESSPRHA